MFDSFDLASKLNLINTSKLYFGLSSSFIDGYSTVKLSDFEGFFQKIRLPYSDNSIEEVIIKDFISQVQIDKLDQFFSEINRVMKNNAELSIQFLDITYLIQQLDNNIISLEKANHSLFNGAYSSKSIVNKDKILDLLNKYNFKVSNVEYLDYDFENNCLIDANLIKGEVYSNPNMESSEKEQDIFEGINFDFPHAVQKEESGYDEDLFNEVLNTNEHSDTLDLTLLNEVINFDIDGGNNNLGKDNQIVGNDSLLDEVMNFSLEDDNPVESYYLSEREHSKQEEVQSNPQDSLLSEVINFSDNFANEIVHSEPEEYKQDSPLPNGVKFPSLNIVWEGTQYSYSSISKTNREICSQIVESKVAELTIIPSEQESEKFNFEDTYQNVLDNDIRRKQEVSEAISKFPYAWVRSQTSLKKETPMGAKWIIRYDSKYSALPIEDFEVLRNCNEIWTSSFYSRKALIDAGLDFNKIQVIHKGVNPVIFTPQGESYRLNTFKKLKFLFVGETNERKGFDILLESFTSLFSSKDNVSLVIKDTKINNEISRELINSKSSHYDSPEIIYIDECLTEREMASLYRACDVFVAPYRASSSGVAIFEAMACALPIITSKGGAGEDYLEQAFAKFIDTEIINNGNYYDGKEYKSNVNTLEPSLKSLSDIFLYLYNNPSEIKGMGILASAYTRSKLTWASSAIKTLRRLDYLYSTKMSPQAEENLSVDSDGYIYLGIAENEYILQNYKEASDYYMAAIKGNINNRYKLLSMHRIATILINRNESDAAIEILNSANNLYHIHPDSQYLKVLIETIKGNYYDAINLLSKLVEDWHNLKYDSDLGHNLDDLIVLNGDLLLTINDYEAANSLYNLAISMNKENAYAYYGLAQCLKHNNQIDATKSTLQTAIELNPNFGEAKALLEEISL